MGNDFADQEVTRSRSFMLLGDRNLEDRDDDGVSVSVNGERVEEGVSGRNWDVVVVFVERHIIEPMGEVDQRDGPGVGG